MASVPSSLGAAALFAGTRLRSRGADPDGRPLLVRSVQSERSRYAVCMAPCASVVGCTSVSRIPPPKTEPSALPPTPLIGHPDGTFTAGPGLRLCASPGFQGFSPRYSPRRPRPLDRARRHLGHDPGQPRYLDPSHGPAARERPPGRRDHRRTAPGWCPKCGYNDVQRNDK
jgi:hypothetical protein